MNFPADIPPKTLVFLSPAKTQDGRSPDGIGFTPREPVFIDDARALASELAARDEEYFIRREKLSAEAAAAAADLWRSWPAAAPIPAAWLYRGPAFKALDAPSLDSAILEGSNGPRLAILSALYGMAFPTDALRPYRLDFKYRDLRIGGRSLMEHWKLRIREALEDGGWRLFIDLSSREFSPLIPGDLAPTVRIDFREWRRGAWRSVSATAKQLRGTAARRILGSSGSGMDELMGGGIAGYEFNEDLSREGQWIFTPG
jgi:cytoplasmic iron level regulating protein YaaA (DUF328/UPF0246 family)